MIINLVGTKILLFYKSTTLILKGPKLLGIFSFDFYMTNTQPV